MYLRAIRWEKLAWVAVVTLSLAISAFSHKAMPLERLADAYPADIDIEAYRLPDGTLPDFCLSSGQERQDHSNRCEYCTLASGSALASAPALPTAMLKAVVSNCLNQTTQVAERPFHPIPPSRGPPYLS